MVLLPALLLLSAFFAAWAGRCARRVPRRSMRALGIASFVIAACLVLGGIYFLWYYYRPHPSPLDRELFQGVRYRREPRTFPRPNVVHVVTVDLTRAGTGILVTPPDDTSGHPLRARATSQFLAEHKVQLAVNAAFFSPWHANGPFDYYPHAGDPVRVNGLAVSNGVLYSPPEKGFVSLVFSKSNRPDIVAAPPNAPFNAVSGRALLGSGGNRTAYLGGREQEHQLHPRTAVGLTADATKLLIVVVDGRQPNYSEGVSLDELADILIEFGADRAINLDGGGSSTLAAADEDGTPVVLNYPVHGRIPPGSERPVANHLGIFALPLGR